MQQVTFHLIAHLGYSFQVETWKISQNPHVNSARGASNLKIFTSTSTSWKIHQALRARSRLFTWCYFRIRSLEDLVETPKHHNAINLSIRCKVQLTSHYSNLKVSQELHELKNCRGIVFSFEFECRRQFLGRGFAKPAKIFSFDSLVNLTQG